MPVKLVDLKRDRRTVTIPVLTGNDELGNEHFDDLKLTYRPSGYTPNAELAFNEALKDEWKSKMALDFITTLVTEWDLEGEDDAPYPITLAAVADLPTPFITSIITGIAEDMGKVRGPLNGS